jgi:hypothetical protein
MSVPRPSLPRPSEGIKTGRQPMMNFSASTPGWGARRLDVDADRFLDMLKYMDGKRRMVVEGIPSDARCTGLTINVALNTITMRVESASFEPVHESQMMPVLEVVLREYFDSDADGLSP